MCKAEFSFILAVLALCSASAFALCLPHNCLSKRWQAHFVKNGCTAGFAQAVRKVRDAMMSVHCFTFRAMAVYLVSVTSRLLAFLPHVYSCFSIGDDSCQLHRIYIVSVAKQQNQHARPTPQISIPAQKTGVLAFCSGHSMCMTLLS